MLESELQAQHWALPGTRFPWTCYAGRWPRSRAIGDGALETRAVTPGATNVGQVEAAGECLTSFRSPLRLSLASIHAYRWRWVKYVYPVLTATLSVEDASGERRRKRKLPGAFTSDVLIPWPACRRHSSIQPRGPRPNVHARFRPTR